MKTRANFADYVRQTGILAATILSASSVRANPIELPQKPLTLEISCTIAAAILLEVICICLILRRSGRPRFFILWLAGMHLFTYPSFLGLLWMLQDMRPAFAAAIGEGVVVLIEGVLIYLICRFMAPIKAELRPPSIAKCWLASFIGNVCSAVAFPIFLVIYEHLTPH